MGQGMKVAVCIASRGRPELLSRTLTQLTAGRVLPDTFLAVGVDKDDPSSLLHMPQYHGSAGFSVEDREDSLGAKYNRIQQSCSPADLCVLWADDIVMPDRGWDAKLAKAAETLSDQCGVVFFGHIPGVLQPGIAVTQRMIDEIGFFCPTEFPYWWSDTFWLELASMTGREVNADVAVDLMNDIKGASRGVREILFWAELWDAMRPQRVATAKRIIERGSEPFLRKQRLIANLPHEAERWRLSNSILRSPADAARLEAYYGYDAPADERYMRLKAKAEKMLEELNGSTK